MQLAVGAVYAIFLWIAPDARKAPKVTVSDLFAMLPVAICAAGAHSASVFSLAAGGVAFGQIVKAAEPAFAAVVGTFVYGKKISAAKWMCLFPIIGGVCLAALKQKKGDLPVFAPTPEYVTALAGSFELDFTVGGLMGALIANLFASFKGNESHKLMHSPEIKERIGSVGNQFALTTILALFVSLPVMFLMEGSKWGSFVGLFNTNEVVKTNLILSGLTFYAYNEVSTLTLKKISAVSNSVANTAKRVVVIVGSAIVFGEEIGGIKALGCTICIAGVFLNSVIDDLFSSKKKKA
jgi:solute carrier family 35 protein E1